MIRRSASLFSYHKNEGQHTCMILLLVQQLFMTQQSVFLKKSFFFCLVIFSISDFFFFNSSIYLMIFSPSPSVLSGHCQTLQTEQPQSRKGLVNWLMISRSHDTTPLLIDDKIIKPLQLPSTSSLVTLLRSASSSVHYSKHLKTL